MKFIPFLFLLIHLFSHGEWIQPPLRTSTGFRVPSPDHYPNFPRDHGAHREYALEWWYWIGHLHSVEEKREFGFQATVFRVAGDPIDSNKLETSLFGSRQLHLAHSALSDLNSGEYIHCERVLREGWQAKVSTKTLSMKVGGIEAGLLTKKEGHKISVRYPNGAVLRLALIPSKPLVRFGDRGLSRKGSEPASVSWYWTYTRLEAKGTLFYRGVERKVEGLAWMDHEISSSQLGKGLVGWDWTCMHLNDGTELKAYRLRTEEGGCDPWSAVYWIDSDGSTTSVKSENFNWLTEKFWKSPKTKLEYPTSVKIIVRHPTRGECTYRIRPLIENQEFHGNRADNAYWEGACEVLDSTNKRIGKAYLELAGYGGGLGARLN